MCALNKEINVAELQKILSNFIIVKAELDFCSDEVHYIAYSELFDAVPKGSVPPNYTLDIIGKFQPGKRIEITLERVVRLHE